jgi:hypothetical protein
MNRTKFLTAFACVILSITPTLARSKSKRDHSEVEFFQSLSIGSKDIVISIPNSYELVHHDIIGRKQTIGFVPDNSNMSNWNRYIGIHIELNTSSSAGENITQLQRYLKKTYPGAKVLDSNITRLPNGVQEASTTVLFKDETGDVIMNAAYFSDNSKIIGSEISQRVTKSVKRAKSSAERLAGQVIRLR